MKKCDRHLGIWRFGISIVRRLRFADKARITFTCMVLPLLIMMGLDAYNQYTALHKIKNQRHGIELSSMTAQSFIAAQNLVALSKSAASSEQISTAKSTVDREFSKLIASAKNIMPSAVPQLHQYQQGLAHLSNSDTALVDSAAAQILPLWLSANLTVITQTSLAAPGNPTVQKLIQLISLDLPAKAVIIVNTATDQKVSVTDSISHSHTTAVRQLMLWTEQEEAAALHHLFLILGAAALTAILFPYMLICSYKSIMIDIKRLSYAMQEIGHGNMQISCAVRAQDEMSDLSNYLNGMRTNVSAIVAAVGSDAALVADIGHSLSTKNQDMAARTEQQASALRETTINMNGLVSTVQKNAQVADAVNQQATELKNIAVRGSKDMQSSIQSAEAIHTNSRRMQEIIGVIDGIAFQTNLLALNAAVEAARAGEHGRGFGVVAAEVRNLAQRSSTSAREIRELIHSSSAQVETSMNQIRSMGSSIDQIVSALSRVTAGISEISSASADQSLSLTEISGALSELDGITHENQRMVEHTVGHSEELQRKAGSLADSISHVKMNQGLAAEAAGLVQRAVEFYAQCNSRDAFLRGLTDPANKFFDRDMYVFVLDRSGTYTAFGGNPSKVGTRVQDIPGVDGQGLLDSIMQQASMEPGWVEHQITNPSNGKVQTKMSYVCDIDGTMAVGCGVYKTLVLAQ